ncbi:LOW QUALITY PROTEIN: zinc finger CCCH domain-containing protein 4-like [Acanthaster planci]|uniref:LOW QUALITY PROTEIN: zinc finger CCCH domain-containing protein 4-like n=1 Tax=Acanthaster planci TaxID=133434 RepID=A0A8B7Z1M1_ACAPL|nr:LOW QUALITY PROTEIN: zinc finger CCCH domain-containing protein 4-like [Acanthaster planci]
MALESLFETPPPLVNSNNETLTMSEKSVFERDDDVDDDAEEGEILEDGELPESDGEGGWESAPEDPDTQPAVEEQPGSDGEGAGDPQSRGQGSYRDQEEEAEEDTEEMAEYHHRSSSHRKKRKKKHRRERAKRRRRHRSGSGDDDATPPGSPNPQGDFLDRSYPPRRNLSRYDSPPDYDSPLEEEFGMSQKSRDRSQGYFVPSDYWEDEEEDEGGRRRNKSMSRNYEDEEEEENLFDSDEGDDHYQDMLNQSESSGLGRSTGRYHMQSQRGKGKGRGKGRGASGRGGGHAPKTGSFEDAEDMEESSAPAGHGRGGARGRGGKGKGGKGRGKGAAEGMKLRPICKFYLEGKCNKGPACTFSHAILPNKKMEQCKFYLQGQCQKGDECLYIHGEMPCKYYHTGAVCYQGDKCKFSHEALTDNTRLLLGKVLKGGLTDVYGPEIQRQPHQTRGLLPHPTGPPQLPLPNPNLNPSSKKIPSLFEIKTQLVGEDGRRIAEQEQKRVKSQKQMLNFYGSAPPQFDDTPEIPYEQDSESQSQQGSFSGPSEQQGFQEPPDHSEQLDLKDSETDSKRMHHQQPPQRGKSLLGTPQHVSERQQKSSLLPQPGHGRLLEEHKDQVEPDFPQQQQQSQQPQHLQRLNELPQVSPQHPQQSPQRSLGSPGRPQFQMYQQRPTEPSPHPLRPVIDRSDNYDHGDIDMRLPRTKRNSETGGLVIDDPEISTDSSENQGGRLQDIDERFPRTGSTRKSQNEGEDYSPVSSSVTTEPAADEKKPDIASVTLNMPAKQRALFMRIQQKQAESSEEGEEEDRQKEDSKKVEDSSADRDTSRDDDNWYSSDEEDGVGDSSNSLTTVIKHVREKSDSQCGTPGTEKPPDSSPSSQPASTQLLPNALASLFSAKKPTVGQASDPNVLAQQNALSSILGLVNKSTSPAPPTLPNLLITVKSSSDQTTFPDAGGDSSVLSRKVTEFVLLEVTHNEKLKDPRADREKKDKSDLRLRKLLWKDNEYTINDTESRPTLAPIELLTPTELKSQPDFSGAPTTATVTPSVQAQTDPRTIRPADPRIQRPRDPRTQSGENNQGNNEAAVQAPRDPRLANRDPRLGVGAAANSNPAQEGVENRQSKGGFFQPPVGMQPPGMLGFPPGGPFRPQGPHPPGMPPQNPNFPPFPNGRFPVRFPPGSGPPGSMNQGPRFPPRGPPGHPMRNPRPRFPPQQGMPFRGARFGEGPNRMPTRGPPPNMGPQQFGGPGPNIGPPVRGPLMRGPPPVRGPPPRGQSPMRNPAPDNRQEPTFSNPSSSEPLSQGPSELRNSGAGDASLNPPLITNTGTAKLPPQSSSAQEQETGPKTEQAEAKLASVKTSDPRLSRQLSLPKGSDTKSQMEGSTLIRQNSAPATSPRAESKEIKQFPRDDSTPTSPSASSKPVSNLKEPPLILRIKLRGENDKPEITSSVSDSGSDSDLPARRSKRTKGSAGDLDHAGVVESRKRPAERKSGLAGFSIPKIPKKTDKSEADSSSEDNTKLTSGSMEHRQVPSAHHRLPQVTSSFNQSIARPSNPNQGSPAVKAKGESAPGTVGNPTKVEPELTDPSKQGITPPDDISLKDMFNIKDPTASPFC